MKKGGLHPIFMFKNIMVCARNAHFNYGLIIYL